MSTVSDYIVQSWFDRQCVAKILLNLIIGEGRPNVATAHYLHDVECALTLHDGSKLCDSLSLVYLPSDCSITPS